MIDISGQAKSGRYVIVQMDNNEMLNLREVEVFGKKSEIPRTHVSTVFVARICGVLS